MATDKTVNELIVNKLTQAQFDAIPESERSDTELYFITDANEDDEAYLPLSGGELTGPLKTNNIVVNKDHWLSFPSGNTLDATFGIEMLSDGRVGFGVGNFGVHNKTLFTNVSGHYYPNTDGTHDFGQNNAKWRTLYATKLNNGTDIAVPTTGGTLARLEDIPEGTQLETLPAASADNLNKIYQYTGETTADYVNGYFYKSTNDIVQDLFATGYAQYDTSLTLIVTVDKEKFLAQNPVWQDVGVNTWRADYDESTGEWYVWTQQPNIYISNVDLKDVWGIDVTNAAGDYVPANGDTLMIQLTESESFSWQQIYVQPTSGIEDSIGSANTFVDTHDTSLSAHENIRGIANGLATLDDNAKVPMSQINDSLLGNVQYQGLYDVLTNTPNLDTVETKGHYYIVSVAGDRFDISFEVGDWIISDGTNWTKVDNTDAVSSVNGRTGNVVITTEDLDLSAYVQKTDLATVSTPGLVVASNRTKFVVFPNTGEVLCTSVQSISEASNLDQNAFISKGTLDTLKYQYVKQGIVDNTYTLTDTEKQKVRDWIGAGEVIQKELMPRSAKEGVIVQYIGKTDKTYTNGYFYKYVLLGERYTTNATSTITSFDFDQFWADVEAAGYTLESLGLDEKTKAGGYFRIMGVIRSETVMELVQINGVTVSLSTESMTFGNSIGQRYTFQYQTGKIYEWQQIDVQPNTNTNIPAHPTTPGSYMLMCTVGEDGTASYAWENVA